MIRRDFLRRILYGGTALAATGAAGKVMEPSFGDAAALAHDPLNLTGTNLQNKHLLPSLTATPFPLEDVRILDPDLLRIRDQTVNYLLALDSDRLLYNFRVNAKLPSSAEPLYNRESPTNGWRGHYVGHFLSACSQMYASTGDAQAAAGAARDALAGWSSTPVEERLALMGRAAQAIRQKAAELLPLVIAETGATAAVGSRMQVPVAADRFERYSRDLRPVAMRLLPPQVAQPTPLAPGGLGQWIEAPQAAGELVAVGGRTGGPGPRRIAHEAASRSRTPPISTSEAPPGRPPGSSTAISLSPSEDASEVCSKKTRASPRISCSSPSAGTPSTPAQRAAVAAGSNSATSS